MHWSYSPPSLSYYPPPTTGQFVLSAWLPPPLLLRYLAPLLLLNGRYWLENLVTIPPKPSESLLPSAATFNLITGFLQLFSGGQSLEDNRRPSGFTNTLARVLKCTGRDSHSWGIRSTLFYAEAVAYWAETSLFQLVSHLDAHMWGKITRKWWTKILLKSRFTSDVPTALLHYY